MIGTRRTVHINGQASFPGIQISEAETVMVETPRGKRIPSSFADVMTLRTPNPNGPNADNAPYLRVTRENLGFTTLRFDAVVGLDFDEDGNRLTLQQLEQRRASEILARQQLRAEQLAGAEVEISLDLTDPDTLAEPA